MKRRKSDQQGLSAIEFAIALPVVLVILAGIVEFGLAFWRKQILTAAVREGARAGIQASSPRLTCGQIQTTVRNYLVNAGFESSQTSVTPTGCPSSEGVPLTVAATYPSSFAILSRMKFAQTAVDGNGNLILNASVTMQGE